MRTGEVLCWGSFFNVWMCAGAGVGVVGLPARTHSIGTDLLGLRA